MFSYPKKALKLFLREHIRLRPNAAAGRVIDPRTGYQYEITQDMVDYICPLCRSTQAAPAQDGVEYACPYCDARYMTHDQMLVLWRPKDVGVETSPLPPGKRIEDMETLLQAQVDSSVDSHDPEKVQVEYDKSQKKFIKKMLNDPLQDGADFAKKIQTGGVKLKDYKNQDMKRR
jgi:DNA-directed RNA polymerase subunit RPC12/RpoP